MDVRCENIPNIVKFRNNTFEKASLVRLKETYVRRAENEDTIRNDDILLLLTESKSFQKASFLPEGELVVNLTTNQLVFVPYGTDIVLLEQCHDFCVKNLGEEE